MTMKHQWERTGLGEWWIKCELCGRVESVDDMDAIPDECLPAPSGVDLKPKSISELTIDLRVTGADILSGLLILMNEIVCDIRIHDDIRGEYNDRLHDIRKRLSEGLVAPMDVDSKLRQEWDPYQYVRPSELRRIIGRSMGAGDQYEEVE